MLPEYNSDFPMSQKVLLNATEMNIALNRLACQLIEKHDDFSKTVLIGIQPRGIYLAERLKTLLETEYKIKNIKLGYLDITFFRDDFQLAIASGVCDVSSIIRSNCRSSTGKKPTGNAVHGWALSD